MTESFEKKMQLIKRLKALRVEADAVNELSVALTGKSAPSYDEVDETEYLDKSDIRMLLESYRTGRTAESISIDDVATDASTSKPKTAPVSKQVEKISDARSPADSSAKTAKTESVARDRSPSDTAWINWADPDGNGIPPVDKDDVIAYRMKSGGVLTTDYPHDLNWLREGESSDIVEYRLLSGDEAASQGPWIDWAGGECPLESDVVVQCRMFCYGSNDAGAAAKWDWQHKPAGHHSRDANIIAYRVVSGMEWSAK